MSREWVTGISAGVTSISSPRLAPVTVASGSVTGRVRWLEHWCVAGTINGLGLRKTYLSIP